jgi:hypothetical protein
MTSFSRERRDFWPRICSEQQRVFDRDVLADVGDEPRERVFHGHQLSRRVRQRGAQRVDRRDVRFDARVRVADEAKLLPRDRAVEERGKNSALLGVAVGLQLEREHVERRRERDHVRAARRFERDHRAQLRAQDGHHRGVEVVMLPHHVPHDSAWGFEPVHDEP